MRAAIYERYGPAGVVRVEEVPKPKPRDDEVLVRVRASTVGTWDVEARSFSFPLWFWLPLRLAMGIRRPRWPILGQELAGEVESVGAEVERFAPGDRVMASVGLGFGAHAEYKCVSSRGPITHMPKGLSFEEATCIPTGGDNALHFLRMAQVKPGERVLVNGAGGNIGVMAIQVAKSFGADVTAVDTGEKGAALRRIGADHAIDHRVEDYAQDVESYDVIFDLVFGADYGRALSALRPGGRYIVANPNLAALLRAPWTTRRTDKTVLTRFAASKPKDLVRLRELAEAGHIRPAIDREYPLEAAAEAHAYVDSGRRTGAVVLTMGESVDGATSQSGRGASSVGGARTS